MNIDFTNKTVLVTGATRGIGRAIAEVFYKLGAELILVGTKKEMPPSEEDNLAVPSERIHYYSADFSDETSTSSFLEQVKSYPKIDVCVNNAGINIVHNFDETTLEDFEKVYSVNLKAPYKILKAVLPKMREKNYGRVVNIASIWSIKTRPGRSMYTTSKNALAGLTKTLAIEYASQNILVNAVSPGFTMTELTGKTNTPEQLEHIKQIVPANRLAQPQEIANVVLFLCSEWNTFIAGQNIAVDGGFTDV